MSAAPQSYPTPVADAIGGLAPRAAAHLLASNASQPLAQLPPGDHCGAATLDALAEDLLLLELCGNPRDIIRCAGLMLSRLPALSW